VRLDGRPPSLLEFDLDLLDRGRTVSLRMARLWRPRRPRWERLSK
jgi:hypothetical protein